MVACRLWCAGFRAWPHLDPWVPDRSPARRVTTRATINITVFPERRTPSSPPRIGVRGDDGGTQVGGWVRSSTTHSYTRRVAHTIDGGGVSLSALACRFSSVAPPRPLGNGSASGKTRKGEPPCRLWCVRCSSVAPPGPLGSAPDFHSPSSPPRIGVRGDDGGTQVGGWVRCITTQAYTRWVARSDYGGVVVSCRFWRAGNRMSPLLDPWVPDLRRGRR